MRWLLLKIIRKEMNYNKIETLIMMMMMMLYFDEMKWRRRRRR